MPRSMAEINEETIATLAKLCRLQVSEEEMKILRERLQRIVGHVEKLQEVDLSHLAPYAHLDEQGIETLREDEVGALLSRETFLKNSPEYVGGMVRVPPVIKDV